MNDEVKQKVDKFEAMQLPEGKAGLAAPPGSVPFDKTTVWLAMAFGFVAFVLVCWFDMRLGIAFGLWRISSHDLEVERRKRCP